MALFKISKGTAAQLTTGAKSRYAREGSAWFTTDDGRFYIDIAGDGETTAAQIGVNRIPLTAAASGSLENMLTLVLGDLVNGTIYTYDGSTPTSITISPSAIGAVDKTGDTMTGFLTLHADPTNAMHAATKQYVESYASVVTIRRWS